MKHYVVGAGMVGCLYDFGPEACETHKDALNVARFYLEDSEMSDETIEAVLCELATNGIYYFETRQARQMAGADYIQIMECEGECPEGDEP